MSIRFMVSIACMARCALAGSGSVISASRRLGTICQDSPNLSFTQPHCSASGTAESAAVRPVGLCLILAVELERDRLVEGEVRAAVQTDELPSSERELDREHVALLAAREIGGRAVHGVDVRVGQQRGVEIRGFLGRAVEPEAGCDLVGHRLSPFGVFYSLPRRRNVNVFFSVEDETASVPPCARAISDALSRPTPAESR